MRQAKLELSEPVWATDRFGHSVPRRRASQHFAHGRPGLARTENQFNGGCSGNEDSEIETVVLSSPELVHPIQIALRKFDMKPSVRTVGDETCDPRGAAEVACSRRELNVSFWGVLWRSLSDHDTLKMLKAQANLLCREVPIIHFLYASWNTKFACVVEVDHLAFHALVQRRAQADQNMLDIALR